MATQDTGVRHGRLRVKVLGQRARPGTIDLHL